jgi:hypothetical protein
MIAGALKWIPAADVAAHAITGGSALRDSNIANVIRGDGLPATPFPRVKSEPMQGFEILEKQYLYSNVLPTR